MAESALCTGHAGKGLAADPRAAARQSALNRQAQAETRKKSYLQLLHERLEQRADEVVERLMAIVEHGSDTDSLRAIEQLANRVYGKPTERVEQTVEEPKTFQALDAMTRDERRRLFLQLEEQGRLRLVREEEENAP